MKKIIFLTVLILVYSIASAQNTEKDTEFRISFEGGLGSTINFYSSPKTDTMTGLIDNGGFSRVPLYFNISGIFPIYDNLSAVITAADFFDLFIFDSGNMMLNTVQFYPSLRYKTAMDGLFVQAGWGFALLAPSTELSYNGGIEWGSSVHVSVLYRFNKVSGRIVPETGIGFSRTELFSSEISSITLFFDFYLK